HDIAKLVEVMDIDDPINRPVPGADVSADCAIGPVLHQPGEYVGAIIEVDIAVDQPLVFEDVDLGCRNPVSLEPIVSVVHGEVGLGGDDDDLMTFVDEVRIASTAPGKGSRCQKTE
ncbi:MAG: hypothetical protein V3U46_04410, partial [Acidimicrobiia bacterium]